MPAPVRFIRKVPPAPLCIGLDMSQEGTGVASIRRGAPTAGAHWLTRHELPRLGTLKPPNLTGPARLEWLFNQIATLLEADKPALVAIEGYAHGAKFKAHALGEVGGMARLLLWKLGIPFVEIQPTQLKQFTTGYGGSSKPQMRKAIAAKWGIDIRDNNQVDAYALAQLATLATAPDPHDNRMSAGECALVQALRYCAPAGVPPFPMLSRTL